MDSTDLAFFAAVLYRDFARGRDDVTVVVLREHEECQAVTAERSETT